MRTIASILPIVVSAITAASLNAANADRSLTRSPDPERTTFTFDTGRMAGTIGVNGKYHGVTRLLDKVTGRELIDARYSALNLYKLMAVNRVMGLPRDMERTSTAGRNWVEIRWGKTEDHKGVVTARYEVSRTNAIDLTVTVRAGAAYPDYEVFMPSYFDKSMRAHLYLKRRRQSDAPDLVMPSFSDSFATTLPVFSRDSRAARIPLDGRWDGIIDFSPMRRYAHCLAFMVDPDNRGAAVLMADPRDCFGISVRYHADEDARRLTSYSAFDLGLIGHDLKAGDVRTVRTRLALTDLDENFSEPLKMYREFIGGNEANKTKP